MAALEIGLPFSVLKFKLITTKYCLLGAKIGATTPSIMSEIESRDVKSVTFILGIHKLL